MFKKKWRFVSLALLGIVGIVAGVVYAAQSGEAEIRVATMRHDDGRVEVAVQQRDAGGGWGERQLPPARFLPPDVTGEWRVSSPIGLTVAAATDEMTESSASSDNLYCVVHHGAEHDLFWVRFNLGAKTNAAELGLSNVEIHGEPNVERQAAAIMDCVDRGALGVASSIPDLDGLRDALVAVRTSGSFLVTFNSGAEFAGLVGSATHYGLDDRLAGELAGREFNEAGVTGTVLCLVHEAANVGLIERCDGLERAYGGAVVRVELPTGSLADAAAAGTAIGGEIAANQAAGLLVLNGQLIDAAIGASASLGGQATVGAIGSSTFSLAQVHEGKLLFSVGDASVTQAVQVVTALHNFEFSPFFRAQSIRAATQAPETTTWLNRPRVLNRAYIDNLPPGWQQQVCAQAMRIAPEHVPSFCQQ